MLATAFQSMAATLVDSKLLSTRRFWREKVGFPQFADDPRPLAQCITEAEDA